MTTRFLAAALVSWPLFGCGRAPAPPTKPAARTTAAAPERREIPNVVLHDQNGKIVHFYNDLVKGNVVLLNFIFTACKGTCPLSAANYVKIQDLLEKANDHSIKLISVSMDPEDTPERLKEWSERFGARPGWTLLSGPLDVVNQISQALTHAPVGGAGHTAAVLVGDDVSGHWSRVYGLEAPERLVAMARSIRTDFHPEAP